MLSDDVCQQIEELTIYFCEISAAELVNVAIRFRNLTTLHLIDKNVHKTDTNYLFERLRKLTKLSLLHNRSFE